MASGSNVQGQRVLQQTLSNALSSAAAEWLLMLLLFLDGLFSFLLAKFASHCKLQNPCLFCSRLDHVYGQEKPGFYKELLCHAHKLEISSLAFCHVHEKLADVQSMCEACLLSFATENKSNSETYRSLVGKLERKFPTAVPCDAFKIQCQGGDTVQVPLLKKNVSLRYCSCCQTQFHEKSPVQRLLQSKTYEIQDPELDITPYGQPGHDSLHEGDGPTQQLENCQVSLAFSHTESCSFDPLSHIGYTELKITSDSESELPLLDDDVSPPVRVDVRNEVMLSQSSKQDISMDSEKNNALPHVHLDEMRLDKQAHTTPASPELSCLPLEEQTHAVEFNDGATSESKSTMEHSIPQLNMNASKANDRFCSTSKATCGIPESNLDEAKVVGHIKDDSTATDCPSVLDKDISEVSVEEVEMGDKAVVSCARNMAESNNLSSSETDSRLMQTTNDTSSLIHNHMDLNDAYKLAISYRINQSSPRDSYRVHEDLKLLLSQLSVARGLDLPWGDATTPSPRFHGQGDDLRMSDASSTSGQHNLHKRLSIERNESGFESLDGSIVSEIEGESPADRLKRQVDLDRKAMSLLYKELEEERNASAIAANQALAMITRLQEEKAAMQMEALQYHRMMEEQAEYDQEVMQKSNNLLVQKEEDLHVLKAEIESYKKLLGDESVSSKVKFDLEKGENVPIDMPPSRPSDDKKFLEDENADILDGEGDKEAVLKNSMLDLDDERFLVAERLKDLEQKLYLFSNNGLHKDVSAHVFVNGHLPENDSEKPSNYDQCHLGLQSGESSLDDSNIDAESTEKGECHGISKFHEWEHRKESCGRTTELIDMEGEIMHLNRRLEVLEADRSFLEHSINSLKNGSDGVELIKEIAGDLRELRRIGVGR